jgi:hypothetical protein
MSGHADSIRRAREIRKEGVDEGETTTVEEAWERVWEDEEDEWDEWEEEEEDEEEWEEESLTEKALNAIEALLPRLVDFVADVATIALVPTALMLLAIALFQKTSFDFLETGLLVGGATVATLMIANAKTRLLQRLRLR